ARAECGEGGGCTASAGAACCAPTPADQAAGELRRAMGGEGDAAGGFIQVIQADAEDGAAGVEGEAVWPFDENDGVFGKDVVEAEGFEVGKAGDAVEVNMIDGAGASGDGGLVFVDEGEGGAGDFVLGGGAETGDDALDEGGLAGAEIAR